MKTISYRDLGDPRRVYYDYVGPLADLPGQPAHIRRIIAALAYLRGLGHCEIGIVRGQHYRALTRRNC